jgi:signal transduction histidine kinase
VLTNIRRWFSPPIFESNEEKTRVAALLNTIIFMFIASAILYGVFSPIERSAIPLRIMIIAPFILIMVSLKQAVNWGFTHWAGTIIVCALWLLLTTSMVFGSTSNNPAFMGYTVVVVCAGLFLNWRAAIGWGIFSILTGAVTLTLEQTGQFQPLLYRVSPLSFWTAEALYILVITVLLSLTTRKIDESFASAKHELAERQRIQTEREKIIKELEAKNAELERFTYTVSHDLKSPLITIGGFIGLLEEDARSGNNVKFNKDLERIRDAKDKMHRLLNELLELSRIGRMMNPPTNIPFAQIIDEALILTRGRLMAGHVKVDVSQDLPNVRGDRPRLVEVLQNLIDNAAKFMGDQPHPLIEIGARVQGGEQIFFVRDNGIGIEQAFHERIFGLFDKLDARSDGTGVGLSLVKRIIEVHGGQIWVESEGKGQGSTFYFTLPPTTG